MEVNYIDVINKFWLLRRSRRITSLQADLYYFLLNESNSRGEGSDWENPLECANGLVCSSIGCSENSLADARNVLQQLGLITFTRGITKTKSPTYYLNICGIDRGKHRGNDRGNDRGNEANIIIGETKQNKNKTSKSHCDADAPPPEKKETTEYWDVLVKVWFDFYGEKFVGDDNIPKKPVFNAAQGKKLKNIISNLKKSAKDSKLEWVEDRAVRYLKHFLIKAWEHDDWIRQNFELGNLLSKFNSITNSKKENGKTNRDTTKFKSASEQQAEIRDRLTSDNKQFFGENATGVLGGI